MREEVREGGSKKMSACCDLYTSISTQIHTYEGIVR